jgi:hypothetical protein
MCSNGERRAASKGDEAVAPLTRIRGPATGMMYPSPPSPSIPRRKRSTSSATHRRSRDGSCDASTEEPIRALSAAPGMGLSDQPGAQGNRGERAPRQIVVCRRPPSSNDAPLRMIRGPKTGLMIRTVPIDGKNNEDRRRQPRQPERRVTLPGSVAAGGTSRRRRRRRRARAVGGRFDERRSPSAPASHRRRGAIRRSGARTGLNRLMAQRRRRPRQIAAANSGDSSILISAVARRATSRRPDHFGRAHPDSRPWASPSTRRTTSWVANTATRARLHAAPRATRR